MTDTPGFDHRRHAAHSGTPPPFVLKLDEGYSRPFYVGSDDRLVVSRAYARKFSLSADAEVYREELMHRFTFLAPVVELFSGVEDGKHRLSEERTMLILTRKPEESIEIGDNIVITVVGIHGDKVRLGITAPEKMPVHREEVARAIERNGKRKWGRE